MRFVFFECSLVQLLLAIVGALHNGDVYLSSVCLKLFRDLLRGST